MNSIDAVHRDKLRRDLPAFRPGDTVRVHVKIREGDKERIQVFEGVVIQRRGGGPGATFTVRKISSGVGVERIFPVESPSVTKIEIKSRGHVRRARLYYLRKLSGKKARLRSKVRDVTALNALVASDEEVGTAEEALASDAAEAAPPEPEASETAEASEQPKAEASEEQPKAEAAPAEGADDAPAAEEAKASEEPEAAEEKKEG